MDPSPPIMRLGPCLSPRQARQGAHDRSPLGGIAPTTGSAAGRPEVGTGPASDDPSMGAVRRGAAALAGPPSTPAVGTGGRQPAAGHPIALPWVPGLGSVRFRRGGLGVGALRFGTHGGTAAGPGRPGGDAPARGHWPGPPWACTALSWGRVFSLCFTSRATDEGRPSFARIVAWPCAPRSKSPDGVCVAVFGPQVKSTARARRNAQRAPAGHTCGGSRQGVKR
jgi:hypothetical protein